VHMVATESALLGQFCWISWTGISVRDPIAHLEKPAHPSAPPLTPQLCGGLLGKRRVGQERGKSRAKPFVLWCTLPRASAHCSEGYGCRGLPLPGGGEAASPWGWGGCLSLGVGRLPLPGGGEAVWLYRCCFPSGWLCKHSLCLESARNQLPLPLNTHQRRKGAPSSTVSASSIL
jgi:hypothetical protein